MSTGDTYRQPAELGQPISELGARVRRSLAAALKRVQFGQMVTVLHRLPDEQLQLIGVTRAEIPAYAREMIYGAQ